MATSGKGDAAIAAGAKISKGMPTNTPTGFGLIPVGGGELLTPTRYQGYKTTSGVFVWVQPLEN